jgi:hypothetical protein
VRCFNSAWDLLEKRNRTGDDNLAMVTLAHASRYHWGLVGGSRNLAVANWQISRTYSEIGQAPLAIAFARSCLSICQKEHLSDILHTAYEGMARANATAGHLRTARSNLKTARTLLGRLDLDSGDRKVYEDQITQTERLVDAGLRKKL